MIFIKKIIPIFIISSFLFLAEESAAIKDSLFATVGNKAITQSDIINEIKIILISSGQSFSEDKKKQLQEIAVKSTVKRKIKQIEIEKHDSLEINRDDVNMELENVASRINMDVDTLKKTFIANNIDLNSIIEMIETELLWNSLIFKLYKNRLKISTEEIDEQLKMIQMQKDINEYLISEIIIRPVPKEEINNEIKKIKERISNDSFKKVAMDISIYESSINGGDLGWIGENAISDEFKNKIINTPVGNISEPIFLPEGIVLFKVRDKRQAEKFLDLEQAKKQLLQVEKTKILNMHSLSHYDNLRRSITINYY